MLLLRSLWSAVKFHRITPALLLNSISKKQHFLTGVAHKGIYLLSQEGWNEGGRNLLTLSLAKTREDKKKKKRKNLSL